jgi:kynurenine formamidase
VTCFIACAVAWNLGWRAGAQTKAAGRAANQAGWKKGVGWGWIWGKDDEVGALNAMSPQSAKQALSLAKTGKVYDLGVTYDRNSFKWPGHSPCEVMTFRSPEGIKRQLDYDFIKQPANRLGMAWHSCAVFINDNVGTQIDGLGHVTVGDDNHWYNGFREADWGGNFGLRKCDATTIPPIIARGVLLDIAGLKRVDALPARYEITPGDVDRALAAENVQLRPGDVVLFRTGSLHYWGKDGSDIERLKVHDSAGISLDTAKYLVEDFGAMLIGADTSGLELQPPNVDQGTFIPVHHYLLIQQGVHIGEFHFLEDLARDKVYEFCYICATAKIGGSTAGFALRPLALH